MLDLKFLVFCAASDLWVDTQDNFECGGISRKCEALKSVYRRVYI